MFIEFYLWIAIVPRYLTMLSQHSQFYLLYSIIPLPLPPLSFIYSFISILLGSLCFFISISLFTPSSQLLI